MSNYQRLLIERTQIADGAVYSAKLGLSIQTGTGTPPVAGAYVSFTTAFGTPPVVDLYTGTPLKQGMRVAGHGGTVVQAITRSAKGSFSWLGTPLQRASWRAVGFLDTQGN